jgi:hypothetical protein
MNCINTRLEDLAPSSPRTDKTHGVSTEMSRYDRHDRPDASVKPR